ncbi:MAG: peptidoglycan DD-metalloendopeptidase family protein [Cyclobacteriaceae bacterium]
MRSKSKKAMGDWMTYLLQVAACQAVLVLFYVIGLRKLTYYGFNRIYLLGAIPVGFALPIIRLDLANTEVTQAPMVEMIATRIAQVSEQPAVEQLVSYSIDYVLLFTLCYGGGMLFFLSRYFINFFKIKNLKKSYPLINYDKGVSVFRTPHSQPFSFFKSVFVPGNISDAENLDLVMKHEMWHVRLAHSFDRMLVDFILVLFWFNPFIYFLRKLLIEVHEYQVDDRIIHDSTVKISYQQLLLQLAGGSLAGPVSFFNFSTIKQRIEMMNRNQSNKYSLWRIVLLLPLLGGMTMLFSFEPVKLSQPELIHSLSEISSDMPESEHPLNVEVLISADDKIPSILPLKLPNDKIEVTSHFGMRFDPVDNQEKYHSGIDFRAKIGTPIIATADGKVVVSQEFKNWGKRIDIEHEDGFMTRFAHLSKLGVKEGALVKKGQVIGATGNSGLSKGPHLHYSVLKNDKPVNPVKYINDFQFSAKPKAPKPAKQPAEPKPVVAPDSDEVVFQINESSSAEEVLAYERAVESRNLAIRDAIEEAQETKEMAEGEMYLQMELVEKEQMLIAEEQRMMAEEQKVIAEEQRVMAEEQRIIAEEQRVIAEAERIKAEKEKVKAQKVKNKDKNKDKKKRK